MTLFLLTLVVLGSVIGDLLKSYGMRLQGSPDAFNRTIMYRFAITAFHNSWFLLSLVAYAISFFAFMGLLSIEDVSFAVPATAMGYVIETILARWILHEQISLRRWVGAMLVVFGVFLIV